MLGYSIGLRALQASRHAMDILGNNLANFATEGYSRKQVSLGTTLPFVLPGTGTFGTGVQLADIRRVHDGLIETRLRGQNHLLGAARAERQLTGALEGFLGEPGENGLSGQLDTFLGDLSGLTLAPGDSARRSGLIRDAETFTFRLRQLAEQMGSVAADARAGVEVAVGEINALAAELADVNRSLLQNPADRPPSSDLLDRQGQLLLQLSELVDVQAVSRTRGAVDVLVDGRLLVSSDRADRLDVEVQGGGGVELQVAGKSDALRVRGGRLQGLLRVADEVVTGRSAELDELARSLIREFNRLHSTGVSLLGPYQSLTAGIAVAHLGNAASPATQPLASLPFEFPPVAGELVVNVTDAATGEVRQHVLAIDPARMSLADLAAQLDAIPDLSASIDPAGRLRVAADAGHGFDFSPRLDPDPDDAGTFGSVAVTLSGFPESFAVQGELTVRAAGDGTVGVTPGLMVEVVDEAGAVVATLDVGAGYTPGEPLEVLPGVQLHLAAGDLSATAGDQFQFHVVEDSDSADILVALEMGAFFTGHDAASIGVAEALSADPRLLADSRSGAAGDGSNLLALLGLQDQGLAELRGNSIRAGLADLIAGVGRDSGNAQAAEETQGLLLEALQARRDEVSGVNLDEEILRLSQMEQLFQGASRYLQAVSDMNDVLLTLV